LEVPHPPQAKAVRPTPSPMNVPAAQAPSAAPSAALDKVKLDQLRRLQTTVLPGNTLAFVGLPVLFCVPLLFMCLLFPFLGMSGEENKSRFNADGTNSDKPSSQQADEGALLGGCVCLFVGFLWAAGTVSILLLRKKLNNDFVRKNTISLYYSMRHDKEVRYKRLLRCLDDLAPNKMFEIASCEGGVYEQNAAASLRIELPRYLDCNYDVYCLAVGGDRYYLLPDCVLVLTGGEFFTLRYTKVSLAVNNISGSFRTTVFDYYWRHARVDGGPDRRYKNNYQIPVPRKVTAPLHQYGVMTFRLGRDKFIILTDSSGLLPTFDAAFHNWIKDQQ
jgi:hypothetical protein